MAGNLLDLELWISVMLVIALWLLSHLEAFFVSAGAFVLLVNHVMGNQKLIALMSNFIGESIHDFHVSHPHAATGNIIEIWTKRKHGHLGKVPSLYVSGTDLTADRMMVFALADRTDVEEIANDGMWVVDLASQGISKSPNLFIPQQIEQPQDLLAVAVMTSSSVPFVFPPIRWTLDRQSPDDSATSEHFVHTFVDGGVVDNTPIDLAVFARATHIISVELTPLLDYGANPGPENAVNNMVDVAKRSFAAGMDGSLLRSISDVVEVNDSIPEDDQVRVYRLAPLVPATAKATDTTDVELSPTVVDFDGVYNSRNHVVMNLFDWFIQGYIDTKGWSLAEAQTVSSTDPILADYFAAPSTEGFVKDPVFNSNRFWRVDEAALPQHDNLPLVMLPLPPRQQLADVAEAR